MKLSIVSGLNESKSNQEEINKNFSSLCEILKPLKYNGIELSLLEPERINVKDIIEIKESYDMEISAIGTGSTYIRFGYSLGDIDDSLRIKAIRRLDRYIDFASEIQAKVIIGLIRGRYSAHSNPKKEKLNIISSLKDCCNIAEIKDVEMVFEPINSFEIDSYNTLKESVDLIEEINSDNLKLLVDSYHTNLEEDPDFVWDYLRKIAHHVGHIHLADTTRRAPGTGHFDFKTFLHIFKEVGYTDFASVETIMKPTFEDVAERTSEYLKSIL